MNTTRLVTILGLAGAGLLSVPSHAAAQSTLGACVNNQSGNMHLASGPSACKGQEVFVQWSVQGTQGPTGATGAQGIQGPAGATGTQGAAGAQGSTGAKGDQGNSGPAGVKGDPGDT